MNEREDLSVATSFISVTAGSVAERLQKTHCAHCLIDKPAHD
jgi:hypothetical protein